ncbi:MAG: TatD family hydrolase [Bacteroidia bacterium]|nr:TatD family hydrolase [Bacteroidia bacterium]
MKIIDTHSHLYSEKFNKDLPEVIARAQEVLEAVFLPNIDLKSIPSMLALTEKAPDFFFPMMGLHPCDVKEGWEKTLEEMKAEIEKGEVKYVGIGETGIDLYWDKSTLELQKEALIEQIKWAKEYNLPIILHARDAIDETADIIESHLDENLKGIFHCFDGTIAQSERIQSFKSFKMGIGGILTYRKDVMETASKTPLEFLVLETDSPYLPPVPHRKDKPRRNESSYTKYVASKLAELKAVTYEDIAGVTNKNALSLFHTAKVPM